MPATKPGGVGCQKPMPVFGVYGTAGDEPSLVRLAIIAAAAACPTAMPASFEGPSGMRARESTRLASRLAALLLKLDLSTRCAAAAAAASGEAPGAAVMV